MDWDRVRGILAQRMESLRLSDTALSERCGVPQPTISRFRSGQHKALDLDNLQSVAHALGITVSQAIGETPLNPSSQRQAAMILMEELPEYQVARAVKILAALAEPDDGDSSAAAG